MTLMVIKGEAQNSSIPWQVSQLYLRLREWIEWQIARLRLDFPELDFPKLPEWLGSVFFWTLLGLLILIIIKPIITYANNIPKSIPQSTKVISNAKVLTVDQWLRRSQNYFEHENYHDACLCLYQGMLQLLDDRQLISQQQSRTDGEYWRLIEGFSNPLPYQTLLLTHQSLCFGNVKASLKTWEKCYQAYQKIEVASQRNDH